MLRTPYRLLFALTWSFNLQSTLAWTPPSRVGLDSAAATTRHSYTNNNNNNNDDRRTFCHETVGVLAGLLVASSPLLASSPAVAQPAEFQNIGTQTPAVRPDDPPFTTLSNGVKIADFNVGQGEPVPAEKVRVSVQCNGRLLNLNGVSFYNTKNNNPDGFGAIPLTFALGQGVALPGLEAGIVGMRKGGIRRIVVPAELAYSKYPTLEPQPMTDLDRRALDSVIKNPRRDATILFDVKLERFKAL